jgi:hypothetical protein
MGLKLKTLMDRDSYLKKFIVRDLKPKALESLTPVNAKNIVNNQPEQT